MPAKDTFHDEVKAALIKDGWTITQSFCAVPFPLVENYEDKAGSASILVKKAGEQLVVTVKRVAQTAEYPTLIREIIETHARRKPSVDDTETEVIIDEGIGHFALHHNGWANGYRIHGAVIHVDIKGDKIWIQHDGTEYGVATELIEAGVLKEKIVLAFQSPEMRKYTDFAVS